MGQMYEGYFICTNFCLTFFPATFPAPIVCGPAEPFRAPLSLQPTYSNQLALGATPEFVAHLCAVSWLFFSPVQRLLAHLLLLIYAGAYLHCQGLPARAGGAENQTGNTQQRSDAGLCKKKLQTVQAVSQADHAQQVKAQLPLLDLCRGGEFAALHFGLLFPADQLNINPARGPNLGSPQVFANHPNKAPPVRFS